MPLFIVILGYLVGSFPTAYIAGRLVRGRDIRTLGDGNMGAQNAFRQLSPAVGIAVGLIDALKGFIIIILAEASGNPQNIVLLSGVAAVIGHNWPIFLRFRGGRGEATTIGILLALVTWPMLIALSLGLATLLKTRNVNLASAPLFISLPLICWAFRVPGVLIVYGMGLPSLVAFTHFLRVRQRVLHPA